jgi:hypothetical protein
MTHSVCHGSFVFTAQLRLASPGLMHVKKIEECHTQKIKKAQVKKIEECHTQKIKKAQVQ